MRSIILMPKIRHILTCSIILIAFFLRVFHLNDISIERDELASVEQFIRHGLLYLITHNTDLNNHPLNSLLAYLMSYGNMLAFTLRWHSVLLGVLAVAGMMALSKRWFRRDESLLIGFFMAVSAYYVPLSQIERGYAGLISLTILSTYFLDRALQNNKIWAYLGFVVCVALNIYSHLYGVMATGIVAMVLSVRLIQQQKFNVELIWPILKVVGIVLCGYAIAALLYLPMLTSTLNTAGSENRFQDKDLVKKAEMTEFEQFIDPVYSTLRRFSLTAQDRRLRIMDATYWISPVDSVAVLADTPFGFYFALFSALLGFLFWRRNPNTLLLITWVVGPFLIQTIAGYFVPGAYFRGRFLAFIYPAYLMLMLRGWLGVSDWLGQKWIARLALSFLLLLNATWLFAYYQASVQGGWQSMADHFAQNRQINDLITCGQRPMTDCNNDPRTRLAIFIEEVDKLIDVAYFEQHQAELQQPGRVWLIMPYLKQFQISRLVDSGYEYTLYGSPPYDQSGWILFDKHPTLAGNIFEMLAYRSQIALTTVERENRYLTLLSLYLAEQMYPQAEQTLTEAKLFAEPDSAFEKSLNRFVHRLDFEQQAATMAGAAASSLPTDATIVEQNFAHFAQLVGYQVSTTTVETRQELTTTLYWLPLTYIEQPLAVFIHLTDLQANVLAEENQIPSWQPGRLAKVEFKVMMPLDLPSPSALRLETGLFDVGSSQFVGLAPTSAPYKHKPESNNLALDAILSVLAKFKSFEPQTTSFRLANLTYLAGKQSLTAPSHHQEVMFGQAIRMLGFDLNPSTLTLYWQAEKELTQNYTVFVHILDEKGNLVGQVDDEPFGGHYPTSWWSVGQVWRDERHSPPLEAGQYQLFVGWYLPQTGERLPAMRADGTTWPEHSVPLGLITME